MKLKYDNKGQVMLLTAISVAAMVLAATSLAGLLTLYELTQVTNVKNSGQAIFAADAGTECLSYQEFVASSTIDCDSGTLTNGAEFVTTSTSPGIFDAIGTSGLASRAFEINFNNINIPTSTQ